jgi:hypothetical protein
MAWKSDEAVNASIATLKVGTEYYECAALVDECLRHVETS